MFVPWILVLTWKKILPRVGQDFFHPPSHCRMPFHPHDRKNVFITWLEPKPQRSLGRLLRTLRARALPPHGLTTLRPPSAAWGCKGLPKQFIREIMARTVTPTKIKVLNSLFFLKKNWRVKVDSTTAYVLVWRPCLNHWAWEWRHLNLSNWIWYVGLVFVILSNYVDFSWCHPKWIQMVFYTIPDPLLLMCSSLVKYYNVAQVWVVSGYLDGLSRNCCFLQKSESRSTGFSSGFPVTVGFPKNS